jgi:hypothetical protein
MYWFLYDGTFQYGFNDMAESASMWIQAGLLTSPWILQIASAELANIPGSHATIVSV